MSCMRATVRLSLVCPKLSSIEGRVFLFGRKVLLVDDERDFLEALSERMRNRRLNPAKAALAKEAIQMAQRETYDVLVLDLNMPEMAGFETLKILKENNPGIHVVILTGHATVENGIRAMLSGAEEVLEKPSNVEILIKKIEKLVRKKMVKVQLFVTTHVVSLST